MQQSVTAFIWAREGRRMLAPAQDSEVDSDMVELADQCDGNARRSVLRNCYQHFR
jgi:hypothetical protein